jgi:hypothetical protein
MAIWYNLWQFGIYLWPFGIVCDHLVYFSSYDMFWTNKNLATLFLRCSPTEF